MIQWQVSVSVDTSQCATDVLRRSLAGVKFRRHLGFLRCSALRGFGSLESSVWSHRKDPESIATILSQGEEL